MTLHPGLPTLAMSVYDKLIIIKRDVHCTMYRQLYCQSLSTLH